MGELETTGQASGQSDQVDGQGTGSVVAATGGVLETVVSYGIVIVQLAAAGIRLRGLSEQVRATYRYVEGCSASTDRLAEQMAGLAVDVDTVSEHHQAAAVMRSVLAHAEAMATATEELASLFGQTAAAHQADYGTVADTAANMPVPMADAQFYSNR
jgi:Fe-S cluster assembly scaffold protein SufB